MKLNGIFDTKGKELKVGDQVRYTDDFLFECTGVIKFGIHTIYGREKEIDALDCFGAYVERSEFDPEDGTLAYEEPDEYEKVISVLKYDLEVIE